MTRRRFRTLVYGVVIYVSVVGIVALFIVAKLGLRNDEVKNFASLSPIFLALPAAILAAGVQVRTSFLTQIRGLYEKTVTCVQNIVQYTHLERADQTQFAAIQKEISGLIDLMRGSFRNLGADRGRIGLYPFESLKTMKDWMDYLGFGEGFKVTERHLVRQAIINLWQRRLRPPLLAELDAQAPTSFDSPFWVRGDSAKEKEWPRPPTKLG